MTWSEAGLFLCILFFFITLILVSSFQPVSVETPQGTVYEGKRLSGKRVCFDFHPVKIAQRCFNCFLLELIALFLTFISSWLFSTDHWRVHSAGRRDHGTGLDGSLQGHPTRKDPHPDQSRHGRARGMAFSLNIQLPALGHIYLWSECSCYHVSLCSQPW